MLGVALTAQRAGWAASGNVVISATTITTNCVSSFNEIYQEPVFSFETVSSNWYVSAGDYDLTGYKDLSGFNNRRYTLLYNWYIDWPSGESTGLKGGFLTVQFRDAGAIITKTGELDIVNQFGQFRQVWNIGTALGFELDGDYTDYNNEWYTTVISAAETSAQFTDWSGSGSGDNYVRIATFHTGTGALVKKLDSVTNDTVANIAAYGNSASSVGTDANSVRLQGGFGSLGMRWNNLWTSWGTMFDPLTDTSGAWLTTRPGPVIGNATAWLNATSTAYVQSGDDSWISEDTDLFTPDTTDRKLQFTQAAGEFAAGYSDTIFPKEQG